jgi:hypothetical protein
MLTIFPLLDMGENLTLIHLARPKSKSAVSSTCVTVSTRKYPSRNFLENSEKVIGQSIKTMSPFILPCMSNSSWPRTKLLQSLIYFPDITATYCFQGQE